MAVESVSLLTGENGEAGIEAVAAKHTNNYLVTP